MTNILQTIKLLAAILAMAVCLSSCIKFKKVDTRKTPINAQERAKLNVKEGRGLSLKNMVGNKRGNTNFEFSTSSVSETDWVKLSQSQFKPILIKNKINIIPTWHDTKNSNLINITLDPGLAFGTGAHPTTHLCMEWLIDNVTKNSQVIDYGCGSGILAIAAHKLGAKKVLGVDGIAVPSSFLILSALG